MKRTAEYEVARIAHLRQRNIARFSANGVAPILVAPIALRIAQRLRWRIRKIHFKAAVRVDLIRQLLQRNARLHAPALARERLLVAPNGISLQICHRLHLHQIRSKRPHIRKRYRRLNLFANNNLVDDNTPKLPIISLRARIGNLELNGAIHLIARRPADIRKCRGRNLVRRQHNPLPANGIRRSVKHDAPRLPKFRRLLRLSIKPRLIRHHANALLLAVRRFTKRRRINGRITALKLLHINFAIRRFNILKRVIKRAEKSVANIALNRKVSQVHARFRVSVVTASPQVPTAPRPIRKPWLIANRHADNRNLAMVDIGIVRILHRLMRRVHHIRRNKQTEHALNRPMRMIVPTKVKRLYALALAIDDQRAINLSGAVLSQRNPFIRASRLLARLNARNRLIVTTAAS